MSHPPKYLPPPGPPPRPSLLPTSPLPIDLELFAFRGWAALPLHLVNPRLYASYQSLLARASEFFSLPDDQKQKYHIPTYDNTAEEGYSLVEGEKQLITLRRSRPRTDSDSHPRNQIQPAYGCPEILLDDVERVWQETGEWMAGIMREIARSLGLDEHVFDQMVDPCVPLPKQERVPTLMRMFRYDRPSSAPPESGVSHQLPIQPRIVSEAHRDLGLLTLVVGESPGLEAWDPVVGDWLSVEEPDVLAWLGVPAASAHTEQTDQPNVPQALTATLLSGQLLSLVTNARFMPGRHRVLVHPSPPESIEPSLYRFSLVHALRAHHGTSSAPVTISAPQFESYVTGPFAHGPFAEWWSPNSYTPSADSRHNAAVTQIKVADVSRRIAGASYNVNVGKDVREEQRKRLVEKGKSGKAGSAEQSAEALFPLQVLETSVEDETAVRARDRSTLNSGAVEGDRKRWSLKNLLKRN